MSVGALMFGDIKAGIAGIACLVLGLLVGGVAVGLYGAFVTIPDAELAATERADARWNLAMTKAKEKAEAERLKAEAEIAAAEHDFIAKDAMRASQMTALEQALDRGQAEPSIERTDGRGASCNFRPTIPKEVTRALNQIGRSSRILQPPP